MKILCRNEPMASHFIYAGLGSELNHQGHNFGIWNVKQHSAFDVFNGFKPDVFIGQGYNLDRATLKCLNARKDIKIFLKVGAWSTEFDNVYDKTQYQILTASDEERSLVSQIENLDRITVFNYCHPNKANFVIGGWSNIVNNIWGLLPAADVYSYYPVPFDKDIASDIVFIGGYWAYKGQNLDRFIIPLCLPVGKYNVKIFGTQHWSVPQYLGYISDEATRKAICSAKICPNIHEPHSNKYKFDLLPRPFNIFACKSLCISDYVEGYNDVFTNGEMPMAKTPEEFFDMINYYKQEKNSADRQAVIDRCYDIVIRNHTYANRVLEFNELYSRM